MNADKRNIRAGLKVWDQLGEVYVTEDGDQLDEDFQFKHNGHIYKFEKGSDLYGLWHELEDIFHPFSVGLASNGLYDKNYKEVKTQ